MDYLVLNESDQIGVEINGVCSHTGKKGEIVAVDIDNRISKDTLVKVKIDGVEKPAKLRVFCFKDSKFVIQSLSHLY